MAMNTNERAVKWILKEATFYTKQLNKYNFYNKYEELVGVVFYNSDGDMINASHLKRDNADRYTLQYDPAASGAREDMTVWLKQKLEKDAGGSGAPLAIKRRKQGGSGDPARDMLFGTPDDVGATTSPAPGVSKSYEEEQQRRRDLMDDLRDWKPASRKAKQRPATTRNKTTGTKTARKTVPKQTGFLQRVERITGVKVKVRR